MAAAQSAPYGFLRLAKIKKALRTRSAPLHNLRELPPQAHIDASLSKFNLVLAGPATAKGVIQKVAALMAEAGIKKLRANAVHMIEAIVSLPRSWKGNHAAFFEAARIFLEGWFEGAPIVSVTVHFDESNPHLHALVLPLRDGRMQGAALFGDRGRLQAMHQAFEREVLLKHGLTLPPRRLDAVSKAAMAEAVLAHLRATNDPVLRSSLWSVFRTNIQDDPRLSYVALGLDVGPSKGPHRDAPASRNRPTKRLRTMAAIFTSPGKGPRSAEQAARQEFGWRTTDRTSNPACNDGSASEQTLCPVGFPTEPAALQKEDAASSADQQHLDRANRKTASAVAPSHIDPHDGIAWHVRRASRYMVDDGRPWLASISRSEHRRHCGPWPGAPQPAGSPQLVQRQIDPPSLRRQH